MTYHGIVKNGVVVLNDNQTLPEGTVVDVWPTAIDATSSTLGERMQSLAGLADGLPEDMAINHDHYLHGRPKKQRFLIFLSKR